MKEFKINIQDKEISIFQDDDGFFIKPEIVIELEKQGTALKPSHEPICMARKPLSEKTVAENVLKWGTGGINIDGSRVGTDDKLGGGGEKKSSSNFEAFDRPWKHDEKHQERVASEVKEKVKLAENLGRFPANLIHDNSEEVRACFPETKSGAITKGRSAGTDHSAGDISHNRKGGRPVQPKDIPADSGNASRFFKSIQPELFPEEPPEYKSLIYQAKASKAERNKGLEGLDEKELKTFGDINGCNNAKPNPQTATKMQNFHPTVKPVALMEYLINMVTKEGGTVLDPFLGSGTTGVACVNLNRSFIGIEMDADYFEIAKKRIEGAK